MISDQAMIYCLTSFLSVVKDRSVPLIGKLIHFLHKSPSSYTASVAVGQMEIKETQSARNLHATMFIQPFILWSGHHTWALALNMLNAPSIGGANVKI